MSRCQIDLHHSDLKPSGVHVGVGGSRSGVGATVGLESASFVGVASPIKGGMVPDSNVGVITSVHVGVGIGVDVLVGIGVGVELAVGEGVGVFVGVGVGVSVDVLVGLAVATKVSTGVSFSPKGSAGMAPGSEVFVTSIDGPLLVGVNVPSTPL